MGQPPYQQPDDEYRRWLEALAEAMGSAKPISQPANDPHEPKAAGLLGLEFSGQQPPTGDFPHPPSEGVGLENDFRPVGSERTVSWDAPRVWDLCKPYVLFATVVLLGGLAGIGGIFWLTQWWIPPTRPPAISSPIEARWDVRRRGLHIVPDALLDGQTAQQVSAPSAEQADPPRPASDPPASAKSSSEKL